MVIVRGRKPDRGMSEGRTSSGDNQVNKLTFEPMQGAQERLLIISSVCMSHTFALKKSNLNAK